MERVSGREFLGSEKGETESKEAGGRDTFA